MGTSQADKEKHHERIVAIAAKMVLEQGLDGFGVADLMEGAGLTHGGFYRHFASRDDLIAEAVERALAEGTKRFASAPKASAKSRFRASVDEYLSVSHRDSPETGCAIAALSSEAWRGGRRVRQAYTRQVKLYLAMIANAIGGSRRPAVRRDSFVVLSVLVGAIALSRSVDDDELSLEILKCVGEAIKASFPRE